MSIASASITKRQMAVFNFLIESTARDFYQPSHKEIRDHFGFKSPNTVTGYLRRLEIYGLITVPPGGSARCIIFHRRLPIAKGEDI